MPIFALSDDPDDLRFPPPRLAEPGGLLAVGGDLSVPRLLAAYSQGIFPWYDDDSPILWWSPDPRPVLFPAELHVPRRLERLLRQNRFEVTLNTDFPAVIAACARVHRPGQPGTWITAEMVAAYVALHRAGFAHSVEARQDGVLVGGAYGVALGRAFFGESMFHLVPEASKAAFVTLARHLYARGCSFIDCQQTTEHMARFGCREIPREDFLRLVREALGLHGAGRGDDPA
ncbi:leucyl/phenylalanyl-tRNA--protein transferase [Desulfovibrio sulfodismutans]|uniref:Leucyl/phenylalanyl-tRNA--protein transferase n=1 Tax=Desulfolutivibrio sulfodismutans TaxID=63561 RepID=A0A7K3NLM3_9BACT|nr:leucyl/phenylalanyl-tRNA--protein transferase [Desulfolutivibrio sulfodismutans]NDY57082.1 leucyl/phenylalanyl-tRNA--protein transferase [Desulfolutivibrio sulfodismutans]QLA11711.1 leucyl/phenylalanyl-tRNA--protein transferase [Desulfolutivibrio sulfodismutans DSM 3696]